MGERGSLHWLAKSESPRCVEVVGIARHNFGLRHSGEVVQPGSKGSLFLCIRFVGCGLGFAASHRLEVQQAYPAGTLQQSKIKATANKKLHLTCFRGLYFVLE